MNSQKLEQAIVLYKQKQLESPERFRKNQDERDERLKYYQGFFPERIAGMNEDDLYEYIGKLWSMVIWGNKKYVVDKIISRNGLENLTNHLSDLLYGKSAVEERWDRFLKDIKGMGPASVSELLSYRNPQEYVIFNRTTISCFQYLEIPDLPVYEYQYTGKRYREACTSARKIASAMKSHGISDVNLLAVDYFLWDEILPLTEEGTSSDSQKQTISTDGSTEASPFIHNEIRDKIVEIGRLLGFESNAEVRVSVGAKVDAVWEAKIGNMGKSIYVFEVQSKGSIDSLVLNLLKAKNNPAVQAVVAVSDLPQISTITKEIVGTALESNLRTWDYREVLEVYDDLTRAHASINKLELVPDSFI